MSTCPCPIAETAHAPASALPARAAWPGRLRGGARYLDLQLRAARGGHLLAECQERLPADQLGPAGDSHARPAYGVGSNRDSICWCSGADSSARTQPKQPHQHYRGGAHPVTARRLLPCAPRMRVLLRCYRCARRPGCCGCGSLPGRTMPGGCMCRATPMPRSSRAAGASAAASRTRPPGCSRCRHPPSRCRSHRPLPGDHTGAARDAGGVDQADATPAAPAAASRAPAGTRRSGTSPGMPYQAPP